MIHENQPTDLIRTVLTCDRCGKQITREDDLCEWEESFLFRFEGGFSSIFGHGCTVEGDFCQYCVQELLGPFLRIQPGSPFDMSMKKSGEPRRIYQQCDFRPRFVTKIIELFPGRDDEEEATDATTAAPATHD